MIPDEIKHTWQLLSKPIRTIRHHYSVSTRHEGIHHCTDTTIINYECTSCALQSEHINNNICPNRDRRKGYRREEDKDYYCE